MPAFNVATKVDQMVTKQVQLVIEAANEDEAKAIALDVLASYPKQMDYNPMVHRVVTMKSTYWTPREIEFEAVEEDKDIAQD